MRTTRLRSALAPAAPSSPSADNFPHARKLTESLKENDYPFDGFVPSRYAYSSCAASTLISSEVPNEAERYVDLA